MTTELAFLAAVVAVAFAVEAAIGFGATVITVALASMFVPIDRVLPVFVPVNVVLSAVIVARWRAHVDSQLLVRSVLPAMLVGLPVGMILFRSVDERVLRLGLGAFVIALSALELLRKGESSAPLPRGVGPVLLAAGGVVHGAFGTGGPLVVYVLGRRIGGDKAVFRATLSTLWVALNAVLAVGFVVDGRVTASSLASSGALVPALLAGLIVGEQIHRRTSAASFRRAVFGLLLLVGVVLVARALPAG